MPEPCRFCGVTDALDRHAGDCTYALEIGAPRLADGEEPIETAELAEPYRGVDPDLVDDEQLVQQVAQAAASPLPPPAPDATPRQAPPNWPKEAHQRPDGLWETRDANPDAGLYTGLWMAYGEGDDGFDVYVFGSELQALRHAVNVGWRVMAVELGSSLRQQARGDEHGE